MGNQIIKELLSILNIKMWSVYQKRQETTQGFTPTVSKDDWGNS